MKYTVTINHFRSGSGFEFAETIESGECSEQFTATEWISKSGIEVKDDEWIETEVKFFADDADPMFDDPISESVDNETTCGKFDLKEDEAMTREEIAAIIEESKDRPYSAAQLAGLPYDLIDGVELFWEPGYSYCDVEFWMSYADLDSRFVEAVIRYDAMKKQNREEEV